MCANVHNIGDCSFFVNRLKYLNLEHNEISSIPHLRLLGARVNHGDSSRHENVQTVNSSLPDVLEEDVKDFQKEDESFENKEEIKRDGKKGNAKELNLDEVDDMLSRNLVSDETGEEKKRPELKPRSSTLTEDPSLLGIDHYSEVHQGPVVRTLFRANPGLNFNLGFHISLFKSRFRIIFLIFIWSVQSSK